MTLASAPQPVELRNPRGQRLVGDLHGEWGPAMAISCHGMLAHRQGPKHVMLANLLAGQGIGTLRFDFAGRGESEGDLFDLTYSGEIADLLAAVEFMASRGAQRIGVFGSSMGGAVAILAAAREERIAAVATLAAVAYPGQLEERYPAVCHGWRQQGYIELEGARIGRAFLEDALQHDTTAAASVLRAPMLILHGTEDDVVPVADAHDLAAAARNVSLDIVSGADHRFSRQVHLRPAMRQVASFLAGHLRNG